MDHSQERDDNELMELSATAAAAWWVYRFVGREPRTPRRTSILTGKLRVEELLNGHPDIMFNKVRMDKDSFLTLSHILENKGLLQSSNYSTVDEQLFLFLTIVGQSQTNREASDVWQHSGETMSRWFGKVLRAICELRYDFILPPNYNKVQKFIIDNCHKYRPWFDVSKIIFRINYEFYGLVIQTTLMAKMFSC